MAFIRIKTIRDKKSGVAHSYAYLVKSIWDKEKKGARQKVIKYIGNYRGLKPFSIKKIFERDKFTCQLCSSKSDLTIDHKVPYCAFGNNDEDNLWTLCLQCNKKKGINIISPL